MNNEGADTVVRACFGCGTCMGRGLPSVVLDSRDVAWDSCGVGNSWNVPCTVMPQSGFSPVPVAVSNVIPPPHCH